MSFTADGEPSSDDTVPQEKQISVVGRQRAETPPGSQEPQNEKASCEGDALKVSTRELAECLKKVAEGPKKKKNRLPDDPDISRLRGGPPPYYAWEDMTLRSEDTAGDVTFKNYGWVFFLNTLPVIAMADGVWWVVYDRWRTHATGSSGAFWEHDNAARFFKCLAEYGVVSSGALLSFTAVGLTVLTVLAALINIRPNEPRERIQSLRANVHKIVSLMPVSVPEPGQKDSHPGDWQVPLPDDDSLQRIDARVITRALDRADKVNRTIQVSFMAFMALIAILLVPVVGASIAHVSTDSGWLAGFFGFLLVAHVATVVDLLGERIKLNRVVYRSGAVFAQWSLVKVALDARAGMTAETNKKGRPSVSSPSRLSRARGASATCRWHLILALSLLGLIVVVLCSANGAIGEGVIQALRVVGLVLWTGLGLSLCRYFLLERRRRQVSFLLSTLARFDKTEVVTSVAVCLLLLVFWLLPAVVAVVSAGGLALGLEVVGVLALLLAFSFSLMKVVGPKLLRSVSPSLAYSLWQIDGDEFVIQEIQRRIEQSLDQLAESYKSTEAKSPSTEGFEEDHSTDRAKKQTVDSVREFIICKGDTRCLQRQHGADEQGQGTAPKDASETQRL